MIQSTNIDSQTGNKGIIRGYYAQKVLKSPLPAISMGIALTMQKVGKLSNQDNIEVKKAVSTALEKTGLKEKGIKAVFLDSIDLKDPKSIAKYGIEAVEGFKNKRDRRAIVAISKSSEILTKRSFFKRFKDNYIKAIGNPELKNIHSKSKYLKELTKIKAGFNSGYVPVAKMLIMPDKKLTLSAFHEMGHALNSNFSQVGRKLQLYRGKCKKLATSILLLSLFTKKKADDDTPNKGIGKVTHFVKKNAAPLTFLSMMPIILEEGMASYKGNKIAESLLNKNIANKVKYANVLGLMSYVIGATLLATSTKFAINLKDSIQEKHENKIAKKLEEQKSLKA